MGLFSEAMKRLSAAGTGASTPGPPPNPGELVTAAEIESVTGGSPKGEPRRNGPAGSEVDVGRLIIWEAQLSNGDEFLISLIAGSDAAAARLAMDRMAEECKPLSGVGERGLSRVKSYRKSGSSEVGVTALQGTRALTLTHTSAAGRTDATELTALLRTALARLP